MIGRYGPDQLNIALLITSIVIGLVGAIINISVLTIIGDVILFYTLFRMFSKNIAKRTSENQKYLRFLQSVKQWFLLHRNKWKYRKTHVYRKCPHCGIDIRLPRKSGEHICDCPKCGDAFDVKIK